MNFDKVDREYMGSAQALGYFDEKPREVVKAEDFDALHVTYKETRRALEMAIVNRQARQIWDNEGQEYDHWMDLARTELAQEAMQGRAK